MSDFDDVYSQNNNTVVPCETPRPACNPPTCFVGSYAPVTPAGQTGPFWVNSYFLKPDRKAELAGPVPVRARNI